MANFCRNCGAPLGSDGKCLNCNKVKADSFKSFSRKNIDEESVKFIPRKDGKRSKFVLWTLIALIVSSVIILTLSVLVYFDKIDIPFINEVFIGLNMKEERIEQPLLEFEEEDENKDDRGETIEIEEDEDNSAQYRVIPPDADEYYDENSTVIATIEVNDAQNVSSESDVYGVFEDRGFGDISIITNYSLDGEYLGNIEISRYSGTKHPMYQAYFSTSSGDVWMIIEINGAVMAYPMTYNQQISGKPQVVISETDTMTGYDSTLNRFYEIIPNSDVIVLKKVEMIDSATLEMLTNGEIDRL